MRAESTNWLDAPKRLSKGDPKAAAAAAAEAEAKAKAESEAAGGKKGKKPAKKPATPKGKKGKADDASTVEERLDCLSLP